MKEQLLLSATFAKDVLILENVSRRADLAQSIYLVQRQQHLPVVEYPRKLLE